MSKMDAYSYGSIFEHSLERLLGTNKGFTHVHESYIRSDTYTMIYCAMAIIFTRVDDEFRNEINRYINKYDDRLKLGIDELVTQNDTLALEEALAIFQKFFDNYE